MVNVNTLNGKNVVGSGARLIRNVAGVEVDLMPEWKITHLRVSLTEPATRDLGYKKPFLGSVEIMLPISLVKAIGDLIVLDKEVEELREIVEPTKK
jgi:sporulation protein YlmC with PRC-barrel domain